MAEKKLSEAHKLGYVHSEAFCLMFYKCKECGAMEILWNSRDGVTPFSISCRYCKAKTMGPMMHEYWQLDTCMPKFTPHIGMRVFVDLTPEKSREYATRQVEEFWDDPELPMSSQWKSKAEAIDDLAEIRNVGEPDVIIADKDFVYG